ncbi:MAG: hypothetical protein COA57_11045 [Flavobacteriales bacterium]|nr:MAG: hypothetical protein COA57_11045 [Flavobacteriales bacterium]
MANVEKMRILTDGKVGIGLTNPGELLHVNGNIAVADAIRFGNSGTLVPSIEDDTGGDGPDWLNLRARGGLNIVIDDDASNGVADEFQIWDDEPGTGDILFHIEETGKVGIGTSGPNSRLHVDAATGEHPFRIQIAGLTKFFVGTNSNTALYFNDAPSYKLQLNVNSAAKPTSDVWTIASDGRLKKDISPFTDGLSLIEKINPIWFKYTGEAGMPTDDQGVGTTAQELQKIAPYMVTEWVYEEGSTDEQNAHKIKSEDRKKTTYLGVDYGPMKFVIINAIKELKAENDALKARISALEKTQK